MNRHDYRKYYLGIPSGKESKTDLFDLNPFLSVFSIGMTCMAK